MQQLSEENSQWIGHVCCTQGVIRALKKQMHKPGSDSSIILGWAFYYDTLARFSIRHWRTPTIRHIAAELGFDPKGSRFCAAQYLLARTSFALELPDISFHAPPVILLLSEACQSSLVPEDPRYHQVEYREKLNDLASRLEKLPEHTAKADSFIQLLGDDGSKALDLFRLATLIYLERASQNFSGQSSKIDGWIAQGFRILDSLDACRYLFPLFIIGCEARSDGQRLKLMRLLARTSEKPHFHHLQLVQTLLQTAWVQDDLEMGGDVDYVRKLNLVISSSNVVPGFV